MFPPSGRPGGEARHPQAGASSIPDDDYTEVATKVTGSLAVKRARHNSYRVKKLDEPASIRHRAPATINIRILPPKAA